MPLTEILRLKRIWRENVRWFDGLGGYDQIGFAEEGEPEWERLVNAEYEVSSSYAKYRNAVLRAWNERATRHMGAAA